MTMAMPPLAMPPGVLPTTRMRWRLVPAPELPAAPSDQLPGKRVTVIGGQPPVAARVSAALREAGAIVSGAGHPTSGQIPDCLVDLTLTEEDGFSYQPALLRTLTAIRACYPVWADEKRAGQIGYLAVTYLGGCMGYQQRTAIMPPGIQPLGGIWAGLAKTLHREIPNCNARVVDISPSGMAVLPDLIVRELYRWGLFEIGYLGRGRHMLEARRAQAGPPTVSLDPDDTVLVSGGGRGIGYQLSRALAREFGCQVIITGRQELPTGLEAWSGLDSAELADYERSLWADRSAGRSLSEIRAQIDDIRRRRQLADNLSAARQDGLRIEYARCDFTDPEQVSGLLSGIGGRITGIVHNAGIDTPRRLPHKPDSEFLQTVATKVDGFLDLFRKVQHSDLKFFCNVGSLTGRLGGMVGQLDYAAANDGLTRLAQWAQHHAQFPMMTLCWPTWDRVGMVTNFQAAVRYMPAIGVQEGIRHWITELIAGSSGEIAFVSPPGEALQALQAKAFPATPDLPGFSVLYPRIFHLGAVRENHPHLSLSAVVSVERASAPVMEDFLVNEMPSLPFSLLLENAVQGAAWTMPAAHPNLRLEQIDQVTLHLAGLRALGNAVTFNRVATGRFRDDGRWLVELRYADPGGSRAMASMSLAYTVLRPGSEEPYAAQAPSPAAKVPTSGQPPWYSPQANRLRWGGLVIPLARWRVDERGRHVAEVRTVADADLWTLPITPTTALPIAALENILARTADATSVGDVVSVQRITFAGLMKSTPPFATWLIDGEPTRGTWRVSAADGPDAALHVHGLVLLGAAGKRGGRFGASPYRGVTR